MENKDEFKKVVIKNPTCDIMTVVDIYSSDILLEEKNMKIF